MECIEIPHVTNKKIVKDRKSRRLYCFGVSHCSYQIHSHVEIDARYLINVYRRFRRICWSYNQHFYSENSVYACQYIRRHSLYLCLFWENFHTQINGTAEERSRPHHDMQFRLWDQNGVNKGHTLEAILSQLIPVHTKLFFNKIFNIIYTCLSQLFTSLKAFQHIIRRITACYVSHHPHHPLLFHHPLIFLCRNRWPLAWRGFGFEAHWRHRCLSLLSVLAGRSLVQRSSTECVSDCDLGTSIMRRSCPTGAVGPSKASIWRKTADYEASHYVCFSITTWLTIS